MYHSYLINILNRFKFFSSSGQRGEVQMGMFLFTETNKQKRLPECYNFLCLDELTFHSKIAQN